MSIPEPEPKSRLPFRWFRDEDFWKGVASNVLSTGILGLLAFLGAVAGGYIDTPEKAMTVYLLSVGALFFTALHVANYVHTYRGGIDWGLTKKEARARAVKDTSTFTLGIVVYVGLILGISLFFINRS